MGPYLNRCIAKCCGVLMQRLPVHCADKETAPRVSHLFRKNESACGALPFEVNLFFSAAYHLSYVLRCEVPTSGFVPLSSRCFKLIARSRSVCFVKPPLQLSRVVSDVHISSPELFTVACHVTSNLPQNSKGRFAVEMPAVFISQSEF